MGLRKMAINKTVNDSEDLMIKTLLDVLQTFPDIGKKSSITPHSIRRLKIFPRNITITLIKFFYFMNWPRMIMISELGFVIL